MRLVLPVPPSWNRSYRVGQGRFYTPANVMAFRRAVATIGKNAKVQKFPREQRVAVHCWWYRKRQAGDLDKRCSVLLDSLIGVWFDDDAQVCEMHSYRLEDKDHPRLEVEVVAV
jgi:Holliday junction resolvase RusA-like endonuclease